MNVDAAKQSLLTEISRSRKLGAYGSTESILDAVETLEQVSGNRGQYEPIDGTWNLIYSTQVNKNGGFSRSSSIFQLLSDTAYKFFFKFAPQLAGSSNSAGSTTKNVQVIDIAKSKVKNKVEIRDIIPIDITVEGSCRTTAPNEVEICFLSTSINGFTVKLPSPKGTLTTVFNDGDLRISKGGQGGVFIVKKIADLDI